jgi:uncharacterized integral membrane protein
MKFLSRALFLLFILLGALIAVSNSQPVALALWPLPQVLVLPLYLLVVALLLAGVLAGLGMGWWVARHHRRRARERASEAQRLDREVTRLRETLTANQAGPAAPLAAGQPPPLREQREQKAIERQSALVAPEPFKS